MPVPRIYRVCYAVSVALVISGLLHLGIFFFDDRPWSGPLSWRKPFTFGLSFGVTLATITWVVGYLRMSWSVKRALLAAFAVICVVETLGITIQSWRHVPSHLNTTTPLNTAIAMTLAAGGAGLFITLGWFATVAIPGRVDAPPPMRLAIQWGFILLMVGLLSGAAMIARGTIEMRSGDATTAYTVAGFLKDLHAVTLHAILVLPGLAWLLQRGQTSADRQLVIVRATIAAYVSLSVAVLIWTAWTVTNPLGRN